MHRGRAGATHRRSGTGRSTGWSRRTAILAGTGTSYIVENFSYTYDTLGNVLSRADANENNHTETFTYDVLNRLTSAQVSRNIAPLKSFAYDVIGNLLLKSDVGAYTYPASGANGVRPHAVTSISGSTINTTFAYDANGNQTAGLAARQARNGRRA